MARGMMQGCYDIRLYILSKNNFKKKGSKRAKNCGWFTIFVVP
jgi:hypothetical protein